MGFTKVILSSAAKISNKLRDVGEVVVVKSGYARNFLIPKAIARYATKENVAKLQESMSVLSEKHEKTIAEVTEISQLLEGKAIVLVRAASDDGRLYGSVLPRDVANEVNKLILESMQTEFRVKPANVQLGKGIKSIGTYNINLTLYGSVVTNINIHVCRSASEAEKLMQTAS